MSRYRRLKIEDGTFYTSLRSLRSRPPPDHESGFSGLLTAALSARWIAILVVHDLFGKPVSITGWAFSGTCTGATETAAMLRSGKEHLESLRDGRVVYIGSEQVDDVTTHPAFRNAAQTVAALYDMKADPALREEMTYEEDGDRHSIYYLRAQHARGFAARA